MLDFKSKCNHVRFWHQIKFTWLLIKWTVKKMLNSSQFRVSVLVFSPYHIEQLITLREHPLPPERKLRCFSWNCIQRLWEVAVSSFFPWDTVILPQSSLSFQLGLCLWCAVYIIVSMTQEMCWVLRCTRTYSFFTEIVENKNNTELSFP